MKLIINGIVFRTKTPPALAIPYAKRHWGRIARQAQVPTIRDMCDDWRELTRGYVEKAWMTQDVDVTDNALDTLAMNEYIAAQIAALITAIV